MCNKSVRVSTRRYILHSYRSHSKSSLVHVTALSTRELFTHFTGHFDQIYKYQRDNIPQSSNKYFRVCDIAGENPSLICPPLFSFVLARRRFPNCAWRNENPINFHTIIPLDAIMSDSRFIIYDTMIHSSNERYLYTPLLQNFVYFFILFLNGIILRYSDIILLANEINQ